MNLLTSLNGYESFKYELSTFFDDIVYKLICSGSSSLDNQSIENVSSSAVASPG